MAKTAQKAPKESAPVGKKAKDDGRRYLVCSQETRQVIYPGKGLSLEDATRLGEGLVEPAFLMEVE